MLDELKLEAEASPTVDQDRLLFSASLGDSPEGGHRADRRVIGQALFRPRFWTLGPWSTEPSGKRPPHPPPGHRQAFTFKLQRYLPRSFGSAARHAPTVWTRGPWEVSTVQREQADEFRLLGPLAPTDVDISHLSMLPSSYQHLQGWSRRCVLDAKSRHSSQGPTTPGCVVRSGAVWLVSSLLLQVSSTSYSTSTTTLRAQVTSALPPPARENTGTSKRPGRGGGRGGKF